MRPILLLLACGFSLALSSCDQIKQKLSQALSDPKTSQAPPAETPPATPPAEAPAAPAPPATAAAPATPPPAAAAPAADGPVREMKEDEHDTFINTPNCVVVVDFHAEWCGPCKQLGPILESIAKESGGKVVVGKFNVDHCKGLAQRQGVRGIPDVRIYRNGRKYDTFVGAPPEKIVRERIAAQVQALAAPPPPVAAPKPMPKAQTKPTTATQPQAAPEPPKPAEPAPMPKDWMPPGMQRK
ncbi:MAG TPA: thioredoxin family protein [Luteolibacter sp.]|nr:thioredoxin family protein [Luteolibacter sp.]